MMTRFRLWLNRLLCPHLYQPVRRVIGPMDHVWVLEKCTYCKRERTRF